LDHEPPLGGPHIRLFAFTPLPFVGLLPYVLPEIFSVGSAGTNLPCIKTFGCRISSYTRDPLFGCRRSVDRPPGATFNLYRTPFPSRFFSKCLSVAYSPPLLGTLGARSLAFVLQNRSAGGGLGFPNMTSPNNFFVVPP